jgi:hypothetical protein
MVDLQKGIPDCSFGKRFADALDAFEELNLMETAWNISGLICSKKIFDLRRLPIYKVSFLLRYQPKDLTRSNILRKNPLINIDINQEHGKGVKAQIP